MFKKRKKDGLWNAADVEKKRKGCRKGEEEKSTLRKVVEKERKRILLSLVRQLLHNCS